MVQDFGELLADLAGQVNNALDKWLPESMPEVCGNLNEAKRYSSLAGGKRIRAALCLMTARGLKNDSEAALRAGCAFELIHTYSLVHDDLPAMDNDDLRRGKPTNHKVFGEAMAILAGDSLLTLAFSWLAALADYQIKAPDVIRIIELAADSAGYKGMIGGQVLDLQGENSEISLGMLENIHRRKTGALIVAPLKTGAIIAGATEAEISILESFGEKAGLLFQIVDDILDVEGDTDVIGKTSGRDAQLGKSTYPSLLGLEKAKNYAAEIHDAAMSELKKLPRRITALEMLTDYLLARQS